MPVLTHRKKLLLARGAVLLGLLILVEYVARFHAGALTLAPLGEIVHVLWNLLADGTLVSDFIQTTIAVLLALGGAVVIGIPSGWLLWRYPLIQRILDPYLITFYAVPFFVFYPLLIAIFGLTRVPIILIGFMMGLIAIVINTANGFNNVPGTFIKVGRTLKLSEWGMFRNIQFPGAVPHIFTGLTLGFIYSLIGVVASEFILSDAGLGFRISYYYNNFKTSEMYAAMAFLLILAILTNGALRKIESRLHGRDPGDYKSASGGVVNQRKVIAGRLAVPIVILLLWKVSSILIGTTLLPGPIATINVISAGFSDGWLPTNLQVSFTILAQGFLIASISGLLLGTLLGLNEVIFEIVWPFLLNIYAVPKIALYPIFLFLFGIGSTQVLAFGAFTGFFPMLVIVTESIRQTPEIYQKVGHSLQMNPFKMLRYILIPDILIDLVVAIRYAFNLTFIGLIISELFASRSGIGNILRSAMTELNTGRIMAVVSILMAVVFVVNMSLYMTQRALESRWNLVAEEEI